MVIVSGISFDEYIPGFIAKMRDVDHCGGVVCQQVQRLPGIHRTQTFRGLQDGERAEEAAGVEFGPGAHGDLVMLQFIHRLVSRSQVTRPLD